MIRPNTYTFKIFILIFPYFLSDSRHNRYWQCDVWVIRRIHFCRHGKIVKVETSSSSNDIYVMDTHNISGNFPDYISPFIQFMKWYKLCMSSWLHKEWLSSHYVISYPYQYFICCINHATSFYYIWLQLLYFNVLNLIVS